MIITFEYCPVLGARYIFNPYFKNRTNRRKKKK